MPDTLQNWAKFNECGRGVLSGLLFFCFWGFWIGFLGFCRVIVCFWGFLRFFLLGFSRVFSRVV